MDQKIAELILDTECGRISYDEHDQAKRNQFNAASDMLLRSEPYKTRHADLIPLGKKALAKFLFYQGDMMWKNGQLQMTPDGNPLRNPYFANHEHWYGQSTDRTRDRCACARACSCACSCRASLAGPT